MWRRDGRPSTATVAATCVLALGVACVLALDLASAALTRRWSGFSTFVQLALPPDLGVLQVAWRGLAETLEIAYLATLFGFALALPLGLVASRNLFPWYVNAPARWLLAGVRVLPSLLWAILFVLLVGLGPLAGVLALTFYTAGFLGKLQYEAVEGLASDPLEAASAAGASRLQLLRFVVLPGAGNALLSQALFMFEYNVRHSSIIGIVGAGGIGFFIASYLRFFQYDKVLALLLVIFVVVLLIDALSRLVRRRFLDERPASRVRARLRAR